MDSLEVAEEIIDQFDDEISGQKSPESAVDRNVTCPYFSLWRSTKTLNFFNQNLKYFKTIRSGLHMEYLEAPNDFIGQLDVKETDSKPRTPSAHQSRNLRKDVI